MINWKDKKVLDKCKCGCMTIIENPDNRGRFRKFIKGHNSRGRKVTWCDKIRNTNKIKGIKPPTIYGRIPWNKGLKGIHLSHKTEFKYKNGNGYRHLLINGVLERKCVLCGFSGELGRLHVHHKDKNRKNNKINNLQVLCRPCHLNLHGRKERKFVIGRKSI